jgi:hypothetical protein
MGKAFTVPKNRAKMLFIGIGESEAFDGTM